MQLTLLATIERTESGAAMGLVAIRRYFARTWRAIGVLAWVLCATTAFAQDAISLADQSVVRVLVDLNKEEMITGTGFMVSQGGFVATNHHVVIGGQRLRVLVKLENGKLKPYPATIAWASPAYDLALLKVPGLDVPSLVLAEAVPKKGSAVTAIGFPGIADNLARGAALGESTVTQGVIGRVVMAAWSNGGPKQNILQHSAAVNSGNSGGPLIDLCGRVVGVNTSKAMGEITGNLAAGLNVNQTDGIFFASHVAVLVDALKMQGAIFSSTSDGCVSGNIPTITALTSPATQESWRLPIAIATALIMATAALLASLRKTSIVRETFTQYQRRPGVAGPLSAPRERPVKWVFRGFDSQQRAIKLVISPALLNAGVLIIGRDAVHCQLAIDDPTVSRRHASLSLSAGRLQLVDLGSTNGTSINGERVTAAPVTVSRGQSLTLGKVTLMADVEAV